MCLCVQSRRRTRRCAVRRGSPDPPGSALGISPSWGSAWLPPQPGLSGIPAVQLLLKNTGEKRDPRDGTPSGQTRLPHGSLDFTGGCCNCPPSEGTAQQQPSRPNSSQPHTRHGPVRAHPTDRSRGRSGTPVSSLLCTGELRPGCFQGSFQSGRSHPAPRLLPQAKVLPKTRPIHLTLSSAAWLKISQ